MMTDATILSTFVLLILGAGAYRAEEKEISMFEQSSAEKDKLTSASLNFCQTQRCNGYTDKDVSSKEQLKFRFTSVNDNELMGRSEVSTKKGYTGYHHGLLKKCKPVKDYFSHSRDWTKHIQSNMQEGIWPNNPGNQNYTCAERCELEIFNEKGEQLNTGKVTEVFVERDGHSSDLFSKIPFIGWSPAKCVVGNAFQEHWWKQKFEITSGVKNLMVDPEGLPVFPFVWGAVSRSPRIKEFKEKFCALTNTQKINVARRVAKDKSKQYTDGGYVYPQNISKRLYYPDGFPYTCIDWDASTP